MKARRMSIVIPTYNRADDLRDLFNSISEQTELPQEVIIADDSDNADTRELVEEIRKRFLDMGISLKYLHNPSGTIRSTTRAQNVGLRWAKTDYVLFLDDDVVLDKRFIEEILNVYEKYPRAKGVQGYVTTARKPNSTSSRLSNLVYKSLFWSSYGKDDCRVLPSVCTTYPYELSEIEECQWLSGCNQSYRREILENHRFDEKLVGYAILDDLDLSYRLFKKYPRSLYITPYAKVFHKRSIASRANPKALIYMRTAYRMYFFYKNIEQSPINKTIFTFSNLSLVVGQFIIETVRLLFKQDLGEKVNTSFSRCAKELVQSYIYALRHHNEIKNGNLNFIERYYFPSQY
jgi:GT2 family glycosyltransferase